MLDWGHIDEMTDESVRWAARAQRALEGLEHPIARHIARGAEPDTISFTPLRTDSRAITLRVDAGDATAVLKLFGPNKAAWRFYDRERTAYRLFRAPEIIPPLLAFSDERRFILTRYLPHLPVEEAIDRDDALAVTRNIGRFLAAYEAAAPAKPGTGNWYGYLKKFGKSLDQGIIDEASDVLETIPLCGLVLSRDDPAMSNLLVRPDGTVAACDFERAVFRPRGWDFIRSWEAIYTRYPATAQAHADALAEGFREAHRGVLLTEELAIVARTVLAALARAKRRKRGGAHGN